MRLTKRKNSSYMKEIQDVIYNTASKYLKTLGWDMNDIADSFICDVEQTDDNRIHVEIRAELDYEDMDKLLEILDRVVNVKFDKDAYFDMVQPGISEAFIRTQTAQTSTDVSCADDTETKSVYDVREDEVAEEYLNIVYDIVDDIGGLIDYYVDDYGNFVVVFNNNVDNIRDRAQEMLSALAQAGTGAKDWNTNGNNVLIFEMERNYTVKASSESDQQFEYMMLDRLRTDCN